MADIKDTVQVNVQEAVLGVQEKSFSFLNEFGNLPVWKQRVILAIAILIIPVYLIARLGTEQYLSSKYGRMALSEHSAFTAELPPSIGKMTVIHNPNNSYSAVVTVTNPNIELSANDITYTANFTNSSGATVNTSKGTLYLLPNEKKYVVFPNINVGSGNVSAGTIKLDNINWQKKLSIADVKLRAAEPILSDQSNPLTFVAQVSIINDSPYQIASARIVFLLYDDNGQIIGVSQRDENKLVPFGRRSFNQLWPGLYKDQVKKVQIIPTTNSLDPQNITIDTTQASPSNTNNADNF